MFTDGITDLELPVERIRFQLGRLCALTGLLNAVLYLGYRAIDHRRGGA